MAAAENKEGEKEQPKAEEVVEGTGAEAKKEEAAAVEQPKKEVTDEEIKEEVKEEVKDEEMKEEAEEDVKEEGNEGEEAKDVEMKEEPAKELEEDAANDTRQKVKDGSVAWSSVDSTLNTIPVAGGNLFMSITSGGFQYLLAGVRATAGVKAGRYMFEAKIVESLHPFEPQGSQGRTPSPRNLVRVGLSLGGSSLFLADTTDSVCFDSEGYFFHGKKRSKVSEKFGLDQTVALVINLDEKSPNAQTVSLFRDGQRISQPQKLPENLHGKVLYPTITYKNVTLHVNLGPVAKCPLPFTCHMIQNGAAADIECASSSVQQGPCEVVFPVGLPEQGVFDAADLFLEQNPGYCELSDRKILHWASKSSIWRPKGYSERTSNDRPDLNFGIPLMDDLSVRNTLLSLTPAMKRNYVVMELKNNLLAEKRKNALQRFSGPNFKKVALVLMGEPTSEYTQKVQALLLAEKTAQAEVAKKKKAAEDERKRLAEERKKKSEEAKKAREAKRSAGKDASAEETKEEDKADKEDEGMEEKEKEDTKVEEVDAPIALTDDEKKLRYRKLATPDLSEDSLARSYASFSIPTKEEGFDEVRYVWQPKDKCDTILREYLLAQKRSLKAEDLEPSAWFKGEHDAWKKTLQEWKKTQNEMKDPVKRKYALKMKAEKAKKDKKEKAEGDSADAEAEKEEAEPEQKEIDVNEIDTETVEDVTDMGNGMPLFSEFVYEDWALLQIRFEFHLLINAFRKDLNDPDRPGFREDHLAYYFEKYFKKSFTLKNFGVETLADFLELVEDSIGMAGENGMLESKLPEDTPHTKFVKLAEEHRRDRARRVDAGDETAQLKFKRPAPPPPRQPQRPPPGDKGRGDYRNDKGGKGGKGDSGGRPSYSSSGQGSRRSPPRSSRDQGSSKGSSKGYSGSRDQPREQGSYSKGGHSSSQGGGSSYGSQKRSYESSSYPAPKQARTSSYSGGGGSGGRDYGKSSGGKGGGSGGYRR